MGLRNQVDAVLFLALPLINCDQCSICETDTVNLLRGFHEKGCISTPSTMPGSEYAFSKQPQSLSLEVPAHPADTRGQFSYGAQWFQGRMDGAYSTLVFDLDRVTLVLLRGLQL